VKKGTRAYSLIEKDIEGMGGNYFDKVERHLSDFHYGLGQLYMKADLIPEAIEQYERAETLMPPIYAGTIGKAYAEIGEYEKALEHMEKALKVRMDKLSKYLLKSDYNNVKAIMKEADEDAEELRRIAEKIIPIMDQAPGILQKNLFTRFPVEEKRTISGLLRTLEQEGHITRKKKGSTYQLTLSKSAAEVLTELRETERE
jgi:tetratricopeptide (TPR) repeat protein